MKQATNDLRAAIAHLQLYRGDDLNRRSLLAGRVAYIAECMDKYLHQRIGIKQFQKWDDYRVMIDEEFGDVAP
jgi:hypothetical protein